ncbi:MAG: hypothetical protein AAGE01_01840 [Pseudomonadota bacterium]
MGVAFALLAASAGAEQLRIVDAYYGVGNRSCNATRAAADRCEGRGGCEVRADNGLCGDPARGDRKELVINYSCGDGLRSILVREGEIARAYCSDGFRGSSFGGAGGFRPSRPSTRPPRDALVITEALYGAGDRVCDATGAFYEACEVRGECALRISNRLCGDPADGTRKAAHVRYSCNGQVLTRQAWEDQNLVLRCPDYR